MMKIAETKDAIKTEVCVEKKQRFMAQMDNLERFRKNCQTYRE
jgi:hypothetical protein